MRERTTDRGGRTRERRREKETDKKENHNKTNIMNKMMTMMKGEGKTGGNQRQNRIIEETKARGKENAYEGSEDGR